MSMCRCVVPCVTRTHFGHTLAAEPTCTAIYRYTAYGNGREHVNNSDVIRNRCMKSVPERMVPTDIWLTDISPNGQLSEKLKKKFIA